MPPANRHAVHLLGDDPRDGSSERPDELDREGFAEHLCLLLESVRKRSDSSVLALIGDWGSGKTSVLELLRKRLSAGEPANWLLATFNPWTYPDAASLQRGFFSELASALPKDSRPSSARTTLGEFARTVSPVGKLGTLLGFDAEGAIRAVGDLIVGNTSASAAKRAAETALRELQQPVLIIVDDLDRLTPDELLEVLKLVRLVGRLPHVYYLLCYDERTLLDVLQHTAIAGDNESRARAYLEKIVQVRLDMPALRESQRLSLLDRGLMSILDSNGLLLSPSDKDRLSRIYLEALDRRLSTPRAITRFLGQVHALYPPLRSEVDFVDFFLVSWLRTQEPNVYRMLQRDRDSLLGRGVPTWSTGRRDSSAAEKRRQFWQERLDDARVEGTNRDGVIQVLSDLFPEFAAAFASGTYYAAAVERGTPKAVSNPDYFDRYVSFSVPADDLPDSLVARAIADLETDPVSSALSRLRAELQENPARTIRKIHSARSANAPMPDAEMFEFIASSWPKMKHARSEVFTHPLHMVEREAALCLIKMDRRAAVETARRVAAEPALTTFVVNVVRHLHLSKRTPHSDLVHPDEDLAPFTRLATEALRSWHGAHPEASPFDDGVMTNFWTWSDFDRQGAQGWLRNQVEAKIWSLRDTIGALTSVATAIGGDQHLRHIGEFDVQIVDEVFGLDRVLSELGTIIDATEPFLGDPLDTVAVPESRTHYAMAQLQRVRAERNSPPSHSDEPTVS